MGRGGRSYTVTRELVHLWGHRWSPRPHYEVITGRHGHINASIKDDLKGDGYNMMPQACVCCELWSPVIWQSICPLYIVTPQAGTSGDGQTDGRRDEAATGQTDDRMKLLLDRRTTGWSCYWTDGWQDEAATRQTDDGMKLLLDRRTTGWSCYWTDGWQDEAATGQTDNGMKLLLNTQEDFASIDPQ